MSPVRLLKTGTGAPSVGGPIIKDKLFFYGSYEEVKDGGDIVNFGPEGQGLRQSRSRPYSSGS